MPARIIAWTSLGRRPPAISIWSWPSRGRSRRAAARSASSRGTVKRLPSSSASSRCSPSSWTPTSRRCCIGRLPVRVCVSCWCARWRTLPPAPSRACHGSGAPKRPRRTGTVCSAHAHLDPRRQLALDLVGVFVFALSGGLVAVKKRFDLFGVLVLAVRRGPRRRHRARPAHRRHPAGRHQRLAAAGRRRARRPGDLPVPPRRRAHHPLRPSPRRRRPRCLRRRRLPQGARRPGMSTRWRPSSSAASPRSAVAWCATCSRARSPRCCAASCMPCRRCSARPCWSSAHQLRPHHARGSRSGACAPLRLRVIRMLAVILDAATPPSLYATGDLHAHIEPCRPGHAAPAPLRRASCCCRSAARRGPTTSCRSCARVTAGRGIPDERLEAVGEHYHRFGGRSPINDQNRALSPPCGPSSTAAASTRRSSGATATSRRSSPTPCARRHARPAHRRVVDRDDQRLLVLLVLPAVPRGPRRRRGRRSADEGSTLADRQGPALLHHPGFVAANARLVIEAVRGLVRDGADPAGIALLFVTHSIPDAHGRHVRARRRRGQPLPAPAPRARRRRSPTRSTPPSAATSTGELVFCSRSGPPTQPWLEPDVNDRLRSSAAEGAACRRRAPIGFVSDHMEVVYDLDTEAAETAERARAAARPGADRRAPTTAFVAGLVDLLLERAAEARGEEPCRAGLAGLAGPPVVRRPAAAPTCARPSRPCAAATEAMAPATSHGLRRRQRSRSSSGSRSRSPREAGRLIVDERPAGLGVAATKSSATDVVTVMDQRSAGAASAPAARAARPTTASSARRRAAPPRHVRAHLGRRPDRRHRQLPLRHPGVCRVRRRRRRRPRPHPGSGSPWRARWPTPAGELVPRPSRRRGLELQPGTGRGTLRLAVHGASRAGAGARWAPASATTPRCAGRQAQVLLRPAAAGARHPPASAAPPSTCARSPPGRLDAYYETGLNAVGPGGRLARRRREAGGVVVGAGRRGERARPGPHRGWRRRRGLRAPRTAAAPLSAADADYGPGRP